MRGRGQQAPVLQQLRNDAVAEAEPRAGLRLAAERGQQAVVAAAAEDGAQLAGAVAALEHDACARARALVGPGARAALRVRTSASPPGDRHPGG